MTYQQWLAAFDGGRITSDGGVMLLAHAERCLGIADQLARVIPDERDADRVIHLLPDILRARIFAIACGYEDADDLRPAALRSAVQAGLLSATRYRPGFVLATDRLALGECAYLCRVSGTPDRRDGQAGRRRCMLTVQLVAQLGHEGVTFSSLECAKEGTMASVGVRVNVW